MKIEDQIEQDIRHLKSIKRHVSFVQDACELIGMKLIENGETELGRKLIANGMVHDNSKYYAIEWEFLRNDPPDPEMLKVAHLQHVTTNKHHPEYWNNDINQMPEIYLAEMVADWWARSSEMGTNLREWFLEEGCKKYNIPKTGATYKKIKRFIDMLFSDNFKPSNLKKK